jgi:hypothetical protein
VFVAVVVVESGREGTIFLDFVGVGERGILRWSVGRIDRSDASGGSMSSFDRDRDRERVRKLNN